MHWLNKVADELTEKYPQGEIVVSSGISPSGSYHLGYLREIIICDAIKIEIERRGRKIRHVHFVDDQDGFRKVPANLPSDYEQYLGKPLCDMPAPDGSDMSYADYLLKDFLNSVATLGVEMEVIRSHEKYRAGFFAPAIAKALESIGATRRILADISGRQLDDQWSPIQVNEEGYLKKRPFVGINVRKQTITYLDKDGVNQTTGYDRGEVKLDWRLDWPARWWLLGVDVEPFGRDHATKGGSYDTGSAIIKDVFGAEPPLPVPYNFVNRAGESKKMSASTGKALALSDAVEVLPPEVLRYFILRSAPSQTLSFDPEGGVVRLIDEFAELLKQNSSDDKQLIALCLHGVANTTVSNVPFSHLVASYQAALKDADKTLEIIERTEHSKVAGEQAQTIKRELNFIERWLSKWAPDEVKFELASSASHSQLSSVQVKFLDKLAEKVAAAPQDADGEWYHKTIYELKDIVNLPPKDMFAALYTVLINKTSGPRAGWFLATLDKDWLVKRLRRQA